MSMEEEITKEQNREKFGIWAYKLIDALKVTCPSGMSPCWRNVTYANENCRYCFDRFQEFLKKVKANEQRHK